MCANYGAYVDLLLHLPGMMRRVQPTHVTRCYKKPPLEYSCALSRDNRRTVYCQNLDGIRKTVGYKREQLTCKIIQNKMEYQSVPDDQQWRAAVIRDLLEIKWNTLEINGWMEDDGLDSWLHHLAVS